MSDREIMDAKNNARTRMMTFRDPIVERVCTNFVTRSDFGYKKYGQTLHSERTSKVKNLADYLLDVQEELMDAVLYIQTAREELEEQQENRMNIIGQNGNDGIHYDQKET